MATARKTTGAGARAGTRKSASARKTTSSPRKTTSSARNSSSERKTTNDARKTTARRESTAKPKKVPAMKVARSAAEQLTELTGREPECVIGIERTEDGWRVDLEVVESRRIPDSTDVLAIYAVEVDEDGDLVGYYRARRYIRGKGGDGEGGRG